MRKLGMSVYPKRGTREELLKSIGLESPENLTKKAVHDIAYLYLGERWDPLTVRKVAWFRDLRNTDRHGVLFYCVDEDASDARLILSNIVLDEDLKDRNLLSSLLQSMVNGFCNQYPDRETFLQWDDKALPCQWSEKASEEVEKFVEFICADDNNR